MQSLRAKDILWNKSQQGAFDVVDVGVDAGVMLCLVGVLDAGVSGCVVDVGCLLFVVVVVVNVWLFVVCVYFLISSDNFLEKEVLRL